ncbi:hypothetical protein EKH57_17955 (plasmid) [Halorubrum sp. BOL3-1]|uniref:hypothetical protein n=1 Tax=Halorubrum sp. BOL3-1 TaxID=2497325 RepID=UPI001004DF19|nr:hypothetical protein [Halorubrum sp. BOL3-1]QAU14555.1 hypothetical protein EKH57_17955 [Halorubrum sp. BOL3-1]
MSFRVSWHNLLEQLDELPEGATFRTPLSDDRFRITGVQEHRVIIKFTDSGESKPLQQDQFETLYRRVTDSEDGFELDRLPPDADPYPAVLSFHPRFEVNDDQGVIIETEEPTTSLLLDEGAPPDPDPDERTEPDLDVYADALLLVDALERHEVTALEAVETGVLIDLYTLLSDVQRNADDLRKEIADTLLDRLHHDRPVSGSYGSVQRTARTNRSLKDDDEVLDTLEAAGIDRDRVLSVDRGKVDDALEVTDVAESDVYEAEETEYVRKAEVDEDRKETRLQGLKDQLAVSDSDDADQLRDEVEELESRIEELTEFKSGQSYHTRSSADR